MNALPIITTTVRSGHNPGDTFIGIGMQWMLEQVAERPLPWHLVSKFKREEDDVRKYSEWIIDRSPLLIYGGMPQYNNYSQWKFEYDDEDWVKTINTRASKVLVLAGGSGCTDPSVTPKEWAKECADDEATRGIIKQRTKKAALFTVRDRHAKELLDALDIENHLIPCTAIFAGRWGNVTYNPVPKRIAIVPNGTDDREELERWVKIAELVKMSGHDPVLLCHSTKERDGLNALKPPFPVFYSNDYYALLRYYGTVQGVISARLHGSLTAWGIGVDRILNLTIDSRGYAVEEVGVANYVWPGNKIPEAVVGEFLGEPSVNIDDADRQAKMDGALESYRGVIAPHLEGLV